jgi:hypothetical protein
LEAEGVCDTEFVATIQDEQIDETAIRTMVADESYLGDEFSITEFSDFEKADSTEILDFVYDSDELALSTSEDEFGRPVLPFYRSLSVEGEDPVTEENFTITSEELDPNLMSMCNVGLEGTEEAVGKDVFVETDPEIAVCYFGGIAGELEDTSVSAESESVAEEPLFCHFDESNSVYADGEEMMFTLRDEVLADDIELSEVIDPIPSEVRDSDEVSYYTLGGIADSSVIEEEIPVDVVDESEVIYYMTDAGEFPELEEGMVYATDTEVIDPAVCLMAPESEEPTEEVAVAATEEASLLSAFSPDDFALSDTVEDTQELELTQEIAVPVAETPNTEVPTTSEATASETPTESTDYFSIDAGLLELSLGVGTKKK